MTRSTAVSVVRLKLMKHRRCFSPVGRLTRFVELIKSCSHRPIIESFGQWFGSVDQWRQFKKKKKVSRWEGVKFLARTTNMRQSVNTQSGNSRQWPQHRNPKNISGQWESRFEFSRLRSFYFFFEKKNRKNRRSFFLKNVIKICLLINVTSRLTKRKIDWEKTQEKNSK